MIDRIKSFFETLQDRHYFAQGLALQEEREKVKRLEKELAEAKEQITAMKSANQKTFFAIGEAFGKIMDKGEPRQ